MGLTEKYTRASRNDCLTLALAKQENCPLLTGDKALRYAAEAEKVQCMGTIWLVRQMLIHKLLSITEAQIAFEKMLNAGRRLPEDKVDALLQELRNK
jgi:predicted nucleic acid-binding protein